MLGGYQRPVFSNPTTDFVEALITNAQSANYDIQLPWSSPTCFVRAFAMLAVEPLAFELALYAKAANNTGVMATEQFIANWQFGQPSGTVPASPGYPTGSPGANSLYKYYIDGNLIPYYDLDAMSQGAGPGHLHVRLINRSTASKSANAGGAVQVQFFVSLQGQQP